MTETLPASRTLLVRGLAPTARRIEQVTTITTLPARRQSAPFFERNLAGFLRGNPKTHYEAYTVRHERGWLSRNIISSQENLPEIDGGEEYLSLLNMTALGERCRPAGGGQEGTE